MSAWGDCNPFAMCQKTILLHGGLHVKGNQLATEQAAQQEPGETMQRAVPSQLCPLTQAEKGWRGVT